MWPWEHLAFGYLLYSGVCRAVSRRRPTDVDAIVLGVATQFPDLVDKPGSWVLGVLPSGTSVAHSVFVTVPATLAAVVVARRRGRPELGIAFAVGYLSHLLGDVLYTVLLGDGPAVGAVVWPLGPARAARSTGVVTRVLRFFDLYVDRLASPAGLGYVLLEVSLLGLALALWVADGRPGLATIGRGRDRLRGRDGRGD
ncbi:MAG: metal-dependent hydrolase [Halosimplex sp.]